MDAFYMTCAGVSTAALVVAVVFLVRTLEQVRQTAEQARRTAAAVEQLATHLDQNVQAVGGVTQRLYEFSDGLKSGWIRAAQFAVGVLSAFREKYAEDDSAPRGSPVPEAADTP